MPEKTIELACRTHVLKQDKHGWRVWETVTVTKSVKPEETALLLCDMWDKHWCRGATERVGALAVKMNKVVRAARQRGITIIHAPSDTLAFYEGTPARRRMQDAPHVDMPDPKPHDDPPQPVDSSDEGCDTAETSPVAVWTRQHPAIEIDQAKDGISDSGQEVWNFMRQRGIKHLIIMGVHTNMCVLNRSFGIKSMVTRGVDVTLVRDMTDAMYNPARPPYVSHDKGVELIVEYTEKYWCPSILSKDLVLP